MGIFNTDDISTEQQNPIPEVQEASNASPEHTGRKNEEENANNDSQTSNMLYDSDISEFDATKLDPDLPQYVASGSKYELDGTDGDGETVLHY
jgi:hypothetical protein